MVSSETLLYVGIGIMVADIIAAGAIGVVFRFYGKKLKAKLEQEFGKRKR